MRKMGRYAVNTYRQTAIGLNSERQAQSPLVISHGECRLIGRRNQTECIL